MREPSCHTLQTRGGWFEDRTVNRCRFPIGPRNTWSNLAYPVAGLIVYFGQATEAAGLFAAAMLLLGLGSMAYHGLKRGWSSEWDHAGMYAGFGALVVHGLAPGHPLIWIGMALGAAGAAVGLTRESFRVPGSLDVHMGILLALSFLRTPFGGSLALGLLSLALFAAAYAVWKVDRLELLAPRIPGARPLTGLYGHAAWHVGTAAAMALMFVAQGGA